MSYIPPDKITSPKEYWKLEYVLYDQKEDGFAIAYGYWNAEPSFGFRWNGNDGSDEAKKGFPIARQWPTWFILPAQKDITAEITKILAVQLVGGSEYVKKAHLKLLIEQNQSESDRNFNYCSGNSRMHFFHKLGKLDIEDTTHDLTNRREGELLVAEGSRFDEQSLGLGLRWHGTSQKNHGNPLSGNQSAWFMIPDQIGESLLGLMCRYAVLGNTHILSDQLKAAIQPYFDNKGFDKRSFE